MNILKVIKRNKLLFIVALIYLVIFIISPEKAGSSFQNSIYYLIEMLQVLPVIFIFTVAIEYLVTKEMIIRGFG